MKTNHIQVIRALKDIWVVKEESSTLILGEFNSKEEAIAVADKYALERHSQVIMEDQSKSDKEETSDLAFRNNEHIET